MRSQLRNTDEKCADYVSAFLDKYFYQQKCQSFERITDFKQQIKGVDVKFKFRNKHYICDEKAAIRYVNKNLNTFSFELNFINQKNILQNGWLIDENKINNSFLLIWINKAKYDILTSVDDIMECQIALIKRKSVIQYLLERGWTLEKLMTKSQLIRTNVNENLGNINKYGIKFAWSKQLVEQPINILIPREELIKMSVYSSIIKI